jgi:hypothetical protein
MRNLQISRVLKTLRRDIFANGTPPQLIKTLHAFTITNKRGFLRKHVKRNHLANEFLNLQKKKETNFANWTSDEDQK